MREEEEAAVGGDKKQGGGGGRCEQVLHGCSETDGGNFIRRLYPTLHFLGALIKKELQTNIFFWEAITGRSFSLEQQEDEVEEGGRGGVATISDGPCERREPETPADVTEFHISAAHLLPGKTGKKKTPHQL